MYNKSLDAFLAVADCGSFTKAADKLFISHTAVIKQISALEAHLGVRLFHRTPRGTFLTASGQCLYEKTKEIIAFSDTAIREVQATHFASPKTLRVGTSLFYPCSIFMELWDNICDRCPGYQLKIVQIEDDAQRFNGLGNEYDFLIGAYNSEVSNGGKYPFIRAGTYRFHIVLPRRHHLAKKRTLTLADLSGETLRIMKSGSSEINDCIRQEITAEYPGIQLIDISPHYNRQRRYASFTGVLEGCPSEPDLSSP